MSTQLGFVIDLRRCIGCDTCVIACKVEHEVPLGSFRLRVLDSGGSATIERPTGTFPKLSQFWVPTMCHNCVAAPCAQVCPANALERSPHDGLVKLDTDKCVGCRRCEEACPYDALSFDQASGVADKCDMCAGRRSEGLDPSCVVVCPTRAIHVGDLGDPASPLAKLVEGRDQQVLNESGGAQPQIVYLQP
jgi:molybdopterin-containing oxidoreductase family iron-sulfur binding subunit/tetrathionate reductase subunit B